MAAASTTVIEQLAQEVKKVWALADKDGNGQVDATELKAIMTAVLKEEPSSEEIEQFLDLLDIDGSGTVEIREFLRAMKSWLEEDYRTRPTEGDDGNANGGGGAGTRKRQRYESTSDLEEERRVVHKKIRGFFLQFRRGRTPDDIRRELVREGAGTEAERQRSQRKLNAVKQAQAVVMDAGRIVEALRSESTLPYIDAAKELADALSIVEIFETPIERQSVSEVLIRLFEFIVRNGVITRLSAIMKMRSAPTSLQYHLLRCFTYISLGPNIAGTPETSVLHPRKIVLKRMLLTEKIGDILVRSLQQPGTDLAAQKLREQAVRCVGAFASHDPDCRSYLLSNGILELILKLTNKKAPIELLRQTASAISILCGVTHPIEKQPAPADVAPALPIVARMLKFVDDNVVVQHCCAAMALILPTRADAPTCERLVQLLSVQSPPAQIAALETITAVCSTDERQMHFMIGKNMLGQCRHLIESAKLKIRIAAYSLLQRIAERGGTKQIIEANIVPVVARQLQLNDPIRWKIMKVAKLLTRGNPGQIRYLLEQGIVPALTSCLNSFKCYDTILTEMYGHVTPSFNFEFINDALGALGNVLNVGQMESEETGHPNKYALAFDLGSIDIFANLLRTMKEARDQLKPWRQSGGGVATEDAIKRILQRVKVNHERKGGPVSKACADMIADIWHNYFEEHTSAWQNKKVLLKLYYQGHCVLNEIPLSLTYQQLCFGLKNKFNKDLQISFTSRTAEHIIVDSQVALEEAFKNFQGQDTVKLDLKDKITPGAELPSGDTPPQLGEWLSGDLVEHSNSATSLTGRPVQQPTSLLAAALSASQGSIAAAVPQQAVASSSSSSMHGSYATAPIAIPAGSPSAAAAALPSSSSSSSSSPIPFVPLSIAGSPTTHQGSPKQMMSPRSALLSSLTMGPEEFEHFDVSGDLERARKDRKKQIFEDLQNQTHFGAAEIEQLFQYWLQHSNDGNLSKPQFKEGLKQMGITDDFIISQIFSAFDEDKNGRLNFREFVVGMSTVQKGSPIERLRFMFRAYDADASGYLSPNEVYNIFRASLASQGKPIDPSSLTKLVQAAFEKVDTNRDGKLSFDEFVLAVQQGLLQITLPTASV